jgi:hypothetical protein
VRAWEARFLHVSFALATATGALYGILKYFVPAKDPDSNMAVPWQPMVLKAHILFVPLLVFGIGLVFSRHALVRYRAGEKQGRRSGISLLASAAPVVFSGYLIQALTGPTAARVVGWTHAAIGLLLAGFWLAHGIAQPVDEDDEDEGNRRA